MRVLITGGSGFIGTNLVEFYSQKGYSVLNIDIAEPRNEAHRRMWHFADILDREGVHVEVKTFRPDIVLHMAARTDLNGRSLREYAANIEGVDGLLSAVSSGAPNARVVLASSRLVCRIGYQPVGDDDYCPTTIYGQSKVAGEKLTREKWRGLNWTIVRPTSIWGPWFQEPYADFFRSVLRGRYVHPKGERVLKSFGYIGNAVWQIDALASSEWSNVGGKTFYIADYEPVEVLEMANLIRKKAMLSSIVEVPFPLLSAAALVGDAARKLGLRFPLTSFRLRNLRTHMVHDMTATQKIAGELPYNLDGGVEETLAWLNERH